MSGVAAAFAELRTATNAEAAPNEPTDARERVGGLIFEDLQGLLDGTLQPPDMMIDDLMYVEGVHWFSGHPESGKTTLVMHAAWMAMSEGRHVVWLDYEGGTRATVRRMRDCGVPAELILSNFHYSGWPEDAPASFGDVAACWPGALIVLDSASKGIADAGLDESSPSEVTKWAAPIVKACKEHQLPVAVIDHVTKNATSTTRYSRGAGSKLADTDVAWWVEASEPWNREKIGLMYCKRQKDREGCLPFDRWYVVGDGCGGLTLDPTSAPEPERPEASAPTSAGTPPGI